MEPKIYFVIEYINTEWCITEVFHGNHQKLLAKTTSKEAAFRIVKALWELEINLVARPLDATLQ